MSAEWLLAAGQERLLLRYCPACDRHAHPSRTACPRCGAANTWVEAAGTGEIDAWTVVRRSPGAGFNPPYVIARIRLDEGPVLLASVPGAGPYRCGQPVRMTWRGPLPTFVPREK